MLARLFFLMALLLVLPSHSWAANLFDPVPADESVKILGSMFGKLEIFNGLSDGFAGTMAIFNGGVMIIGGVLMIYSLIVGTIGTAHDGEVMGKKYSSVWIPLRTVLATALVLPVINGSYCLMQFIVGWLILQGVGLADSLWTEYMSVTNIKETGTLGIGDQDYKSAAWNIFGSAICVAGYNKIAEMQATQGVLQQKPTFAITPVSATGGRTWNFGVADKKGGFNPTSCGSVFYETSDNVAAKKAEQALDRAGSNSGLTVNAVSRDEIVAILANSSTAGVAATQTMISSLKTLADSYVANPTMSPEAINTQVTNVALTFSNVMKGQTNQLLSKAFDTTTLSENARQEGWFLAGAWYMKMVNIMDLANNIMNMAPQATGAKPSSNADYYNEFDKKYGYLLRYVEERNGVKLGIAENVPEKDSRNETTYSRVKDTLSMGVDVVLGGLSLEEALKRSFKDNFNFFLIQKEDHPVMVMKAMGNFLFKTAFAILAVMIYVRESVGEGASYDFLKMIMMIFLPLCIALGFTLNFVMPMMPFMIWLGCILAWVILCVEAIVAAPMWAVMHLSMSGDDMVGTGAQGYKLVLSLMLRPALMIFGLIASLTIVQVMGMFINRVFLSVYTLSQQDYGLMTMIFGILAVPVLYLGAMWVLIIRSMNIVHQIPDQLLQWFGGGGSQLGEAAQSVGGLQSQAFAATVATSKMVQSFPNSYTQMSQQKHHREQSELAQQSKERGEMEKNSENLDRTSGQGAGDLAESMASNENPQLGGVGQGGAKGSEARSMARTNASNKVKNASSAISANPGNSSAVAGFNREMGEAMRDPNNKKSFSELVDEKLPAAFDKENGAGSFDMAQKISGTDGMKASEAINNPQFRMASQAFQELSGAGGAGVVGDAIKNSGGIFSSNAEKMANIVKTVESASGVSGLGSSVMNKAPGQ